MNLSATIIKNALRGISTKDREVVAEKVGISLRTLLSAASGKTDLGMETIAKLSKELKVDLFSMYHDELVKEDITFVQETALDYGNKSPLTTLSFSVRGRPSNFTNFGDFLFEVRSVAEKFQLEVV